jgi:CBS domain-containing protein
MRELDIGAIVVCDGTNRPIGVITDRDITVRCTALGLDNSSTRVSQCMSRDVCSVSEDSTTKDAERLMEERQIRRVVVTDSQGKLRGIVALSDIVGVDRGMTGRIVEKVTQPASGYSS